MSVYATSDLHGNYCLYEKIIDFLKPEDKLYFLGDACDRGPHGYQIMKEMLENPQIIYLKGNHENMFVKAATEYLDEKYTDDLAWFCGATAQQDYFSNGGRTTFKFWKSDKCPSDILKKLRNLPTLATYENTQGHSVIMTHSGSITDPLWDRIYIHMFEKLPDYIRVVHGHTPVPLQANLSDLTAVCPYFYNNNQKINIDMATYHTNQITLLNLDNYSNTMLSI